MKTPYYVIHKKEIEQNLLRLESALNEYWGNFIIGYSFKTNSLPWLITFMKSQGLFAEVVSNDEYTLAKKLGYPVDRIIYNGPLKSRDTYVEAVRQGAIVNIDSKRELDWLIEIGYLADSKIGLRVNFDMENECCGETQCGVEDGRFGFSYENGELEKVLIYLMDKKITINGLHLHCSSKTRSLNIYSTMAKKTVEAIEKYKLQLDYIDIGGGFFGGIQGQPSFEDYIKAISDRLLLCVNPKRTKLILEPGMSVIGAYIDYVTTVIDVKSTLHNHFIVTDGSRTNIDPFMKKNSYLYNVRQINDNSNMKKKQTICGFTCMEHDRLFRLTDSPELMVGDQITYYKVGAYTISLTPLFIQFFPAIYVKENDIYYCVRRKWTENDYLAGNILYEEV